MQSNLYQSCFNVSSVISILGGGLNIKLPRRICTSGLASAVCQECESGNNSNSTHPLSLAILRESAAAIIDISKGLCSCIRKVMFLNDSKQLTRSMKVLQNTIRRGVTIFTNCSPSSMLASPCAPYCCPDYATRSMTTFAKNVLAGKHLDAYIFPSADFCASRVDYLDIYTVNLESDVNFTVFYDLIYLYIYTFYCSWSSCNWATYPRVLLYTLAYFSLNLIVSVIRIHDKYQSLIIIGLALTEKASSRIQCILFHFRSYWRGWRPLVTPWAGCIKEGIEPRIFQKRFMPSHAQVRFPLCSLLLLLLCFCFYCSYCYYYYYYYEYLLAKGFYNSSGYEYKPGHFNKQNIFLVLCFLPLFALLSSLSLLMTIMWVEGDLTYIISPACSSLLLVTLLSSLSRLMTIMWVEGDLTYIISPACSSLLLVTLLSSLSRLMTIMWVEGDLTYIISPACSSLLLVTLFSSLSRLMTIMWVEGDLTYIISPACSSLLLVTLLSSLSRLMTIMWVEGDLTYIISPACSSLLLVTLFSSLSRLMTIMWVEGDLTYIISPACSSLLLVTLLSSLSRLMTIMWVEGDLTYIISPACSSLLLVTLFSSLSRLMTIMWVEGDLTYIISPACSSLSLVTLLSSLSMLMTIVWLYISLILLDAVVGRYC